ncbi:MAG TPA: DUF2271 domain-containing protein [Povalibacter sp.]|uniref:DUF2271 domain-containing protein n=1 Tax=Povalibacter sp. TaxID=1962978 RepID=UPI002B555823|nr:DUF2271 domain-containing protein [Povalibacter sp.]HMN46465.1 DUF2271 domain-containing protein [Povalibacter sp.]
MPFETLPPPMPALEVPAADAGAFVFRDECVLGTRMLLAFTAQSLRVAQEAAFAVRAEIDRLRRVLDHRDPDSELSQLNRASRHQASAELFDVVSLAEHWQRVSSGAFSGRLGQALNLWRQAVHELPSRIELQDAVARTMAAEVGFDPRTRTIVRPDAVLFSLDALAKGWIVDRAFDAACRVQGVAGALVDIGGDIRCGGQTPQSAGWRVGIADPTRPFDNAPLVATTHLRDEGIATSGRGPRDPLVRGARHSVTLSPFTGWPVDQRRSVSVIAASAAEADAMATTLLVLQEEKALDLANRHGVAARIARDDGSIRVTDAGRERFSVASSAGPSAWSDGWQALATFTAPRRQLIRDPSFRSPYLAMWITAPDNRPVRTLLLVGKRADWQKDNYLWWSMNRAHTDRLVTTRSMSTSGAGVYNVFWDGVDDAGERVPAGTYVLHVETSRERGRHTYRSLTLELGTARRFVQELPPTEEGGGLRVSFDHY